MNQRMPINCELNPERTGELPLRKLPEQAIETARRYWTYQRLERSNRLQSQEVRAARDFLLGHLGLPDPFADRELQRRLVQQIQSADPAVTRLALACLRCFVSHQIQQVCLGLEQQFGARAGFKQSDLYPYLLDDPDPMADLSPYQPLSIQVLRRFDPNQSSLSTWTKRLVWQDKRLQRLLLEDYGIYLATDWGLLLQATSERLRRLLANRLMPGELEQFCQLLESYHRVYRSDRLVQGIGGSRCAEPTPEQLQRMAAYLQASNLPGFSSTDPQSLLKKLRQLAQHLRQLKAMPLSLDLEPIKWQADRPVEEISDAENIQNECLSTYRRVAQSCLRRTVDEVITARVASYLRRRQRTAADLPKHQAYLTAMRLFHCQGQSMTEIAPQVGLTQQYQVSRLLQLPELQADLHQRWLLRISVELPQSLQEILEPRQLAQLQQELADFIRRLDQAKANEATKSAATRFGPEDWHDHLRRISADLPHVASLETLIDRQLEDYRAEIYSPNRLGSTGQISTCICQSLKT